MAFTVDDAFSLIEAAHGRERLAHAFLISGPRGSGKEELAARIIRMLDGREAPQQDMFGETVREEVPPLDELGGDAVRILRPQSKSRRIKVDDVRELEGSFYVVAGPQAWKVGVIAAADRMMPEATNAFLKTLEEPPPRTLLLLLSDNPGALLPTVISRCVRIPLRGEPDLSGAGGAELVDGLNRVAAAGFGSARAALSLKALFAAMLGDAKERAEAAAEEALKEEQKALGKAVEGDWLKRREESLKASAQSEYLGERARLFDLLQSWMADLLRLRAGAGGLDFEPTAAVRELAAAEELPRLLQRMEAVEELRATLDTNAQEQLALEVGFLKAFG